MPDRAPLLSTAALEVLLSVVETPDAVISGAVLADYFGEVATPLLGAGLLKPHDQEPVTASLADHDDAPVTLTWSPDKGGLGYFSPTAGWVSVGDDRLARYRVDFPVLLARMMLHADVSSRSGPVTLVPNLLWEIGDVRLGRRTERVSIWFGRRLYDPVAWQQIGSVASARPAARLRVLLTSTASDRLPPALPGHLLVAVRDVVDYSAGLAIHPDILAARLDGTQRPNVDSAIDLSPNGTRLTINGSIVIHFRSAKHIEIIRTLVVCHEEGKGIRPRTWQECRDFAVFIGGPNPALRDEQPYSPAHFAAVCERFGDPAALDRYDTVFVDSITVAGRLCFQWCKGQPEAFSDKTGKADVRGAYGLHGREMIGRLTHLQHTRAKNVWFVGILDEKLDDFNRRFFAPQIDGAKTGNELPGIVDEVTTLPPAV